MKKSGESRFSLTLVIKRPIGEFVMSVEGVTFSVDTAPMSQYTVHLTAHVKTPTGKLRNTVRANSEFLIAHKREVTALVDSSFFVTSEYGKDREWK